MERKPDWLLGFPVQIYCNRLGNWMDVDLIFKIAAVGIIVAVLNQLLVRSGREEQAMLTTLAGLIVVLTIIVTEIGDLFSTVKSVFGL